MRISTSILLALLLAACATVPGGTQRPQAGSEESRIEASVLAVYNVISGPPGGRDWDRFETLFAPGATLVATRTAADGTPGAVLMTPKDYIARATPRFKEKGWFERPVASRILHYGNIAEVWSTYEGREAVNDEKASVRGINTFALVRIGSEWKVQSILWQQEDAAHPIPSEFAPR